MTRTKEEIINRAISREIESNSLYLDYYRIVKEPRAKKLLKELAREEESHRTLLERCSQKDAGKLPRIRKTEDLHITDHMNARSIDENSDIQDVLLYAIKKETQARDFYSDSIDKAGDPDLIDALRFLENEELSHKVRLEKLYKKMFMAWD
jgi:rubrerythrin